MLHINKCNISIERVSDPEANREWFNSQKDLRVRVTQGVQRLLLVLVLFGFVDFNEAETLGVSLASHHDECLTDLHHRFNL